MKKLIWALSGALALIGSTAISSAAPFNSPEAKEMVRVADRWLALVDDGAYLHSYEVASERLKGMVEAEAWEEMIEDARDEVGAIVFRAVMSKRMVMSSPEAPEGAWIIEYESIFDGDETRKERVTLVPGRGGMWRVAGYYMYK